MGGAAIASFVGCMLLASSAQAGTDLRSVLADAPSVDWIERTPAPDLLEGAFTAHDYTVYVNDNGGSEDALGRYGFVAGYGREWVQQGSKDYLTERVFQFASPGGAADWYSDLKIDMQTIKEFHAEIPSLSPGTAGQVDSFGARLDYSDGDHGYRIYFTRVNLMFAVSMYSYSTDLSAEVLAQARSQYALAPDSGIGSTTGPASSRPSIPSGVYVLAIIVFILLAVVLPVVVLRTTRASRFSPAIVPPGTHLSPDGFYWWDGTRWRLLSNDPPPKTAP